MIAEGGGGKAFATNPALALDQPVEQGAAGARRQHAREPGVSVHQTSEFRVADFQQLQHIADAPLRRAQQQRGSLRGKGDLRTMRSL